MALHPHRQIRLTKLRLLEWRSPSFQAIAMTLLTKLFGTRQKADAPRHSVYLHQGNPIALQAALDEVAITTNAELLSAWTNHYSGYIRETAIARCVELRNPVFLDCFVRRLNDWVPEVRRAAADGLLTLLAALPIEHFIPLLPRLRALTEARRTDHGAWLFRFEQDLLKAGGKPGIVAALHDSDFRLRRGAYSVCMAHSLLEPAELAEYGLRSGDILIARQAITLLEAFPPEVQLNYLQLAGVSNFGLIRAAALRAMLQRPSTQHVEDFARNALFDPQGSIRGIARAWLTAKGIDVPHICSTALSSGSLTARQMRATLSLLAETGGDTAAETIRCYANDSRVDVRARSLLLWSRLSSANGDAIADQALSDPSPKVREVGVLICTQQGAYVPLARIRALLDTYGDYRSALRICRREKWDHLACLAMVIELDRDLRTELHEILGVWLRQEGASWTKPTDEHVALLSRNEAAVGLKALAGSLAAQLENRLQEHGIWA